MNSGEVFALCCVVVIVAVVGCVSVSIVDGDYRKGTIEIEEPVEEDEEEIDDKR